LRLNRIPVDKQIGGIKRLDYHPARLSGNIESMPACYIVNLHHTNGVIMFKSLLLIFIFSVSSNELYAQSSIQNDLKSFMEGSKARFSTDGYPKSQGINIQIDFPKSWTKKSGERPHIVQKFSSSGGGGIAKVAILNITPIPAYLKGVSDNEIAENLFNPKLIKDQLPENSELLFVNPTKYDGEPGIFFYYFTQFSRAGANFASLMVSHRFLYKRVTVDYSIAYSILITPTQKEPSKQQVESFLGLAIQMGNSIILPDKYK
jgi:hypothetical protein